MKNIVSTFEKNVAHSAASIFFISDKTILTYADMNILSNKVMRHLKDLDNTKMIAIDFKRSSPLLYASIIAAWRLNKLVVPLSKQWTQEKKIVTLKTLDIQCILGDEQIFDNDCHMQFSSFKIDAQTLYLGTTTTINQKNELPNHLAYVLFTSGSTGSPKAVPIKHENLFAYLKGLTREIPGLCQERIANVSEPTFDIFFQDLLVTWYTGSSIIPIEKNQFLNIADIIDKHKITFWFSVPSFIRLLYPLHGVILEKMYSIKYSLFCGEALTCTDVRKWRSLAPLSEIYNLYGPTEATVAVSIKLVKKSEDEGGNGIVSLGKIFSDTEYMIMPNVVSESAGELYLSGLQVFNGYAYSEKDSGLKKINGKFWYSTGDIVKLNSEKELVYCGRVDRQVKIHGRRIELQNLECQLSEFFQDDGVYIVPALNPDGQYCIGIQIYFLDRLKEKINFQKLSMVVDAPILSTHFISKTPMNQNGKVDYKALEENYGAEKKSKECYAIDKI